MRATLDHIEDIAKNIKSFWFKPEREVRYTAGQFTELRIPHQNPDKRGDKRWFTLSSSPSENMLSITTKHAVENGSSFKEALFSLPVGTEVNLADPMGDFVLPKDTSIPIIFVAGGIGATPMRSMTKFLKDTAEQRDLRVIYAANSPAEVAFKDIFESTATKFDIVLREAPTGWTGASGTLTAEKIFELAGRDDRALIYLSGPEPMVEALEKDLRANGVNKKRLVTDFFPGYVGI